MNSHKQTKYEIRGVKARLLLLSICLLLFVLPVQAQDARVILTTREVTIKQALDEIQRQTPYKYLVNWDYINPAKRVLVSGNVLSAKDLLRQVLAGTGYHYQMHNNHIVLVSTPVNVPQQQVGATQNSGMLAPAAKATIQQQPRSSMINDTYPTYNYSQMKFVPDPASNTTMRAIPARPHSQWSNTTGNGENIDVVMLHFGVAKSILERHFMDNARQLNIIDRTFSNMKLVEDMDYVTITAAASPEGDLIINEQLAAERALAIKSYILWRYPYINRDRIITYSIGEDWSGLKKMVEDDPYVPAKYEVLNVLTMPMSNEERKGRLKYIAGGEAYHYLNNHILPLLRGGATCMIYLKKDRVHTPPRQTVKSPVAATKKVQGRRDTVVHIYVDSMQIRRTNQSLYKEKTGQTMPAWRMYQSDPVYIALKTNLLYDVALLPNIGAEFALGSDFSLETEVMGAWWNFKSRHNYYRVMSGGLELRKWFGQTSPVPLRGHFIGLYGMAGTYNLKLGSNGYKSDGNISYSAGLTYGYSMPVAPRLNIEFSLGIGYLGGKYKKYTYNETDNCYPWLGTRQRNYFGPTKAKISLVWLIGSGTN